VSNFAMRFLADFRFESCRRAEQTIPSNRARGFEAREFELRICNRARRHERPTTGDLVVGR
jgi:hypothetical protein